MRNFIHTLRRFKMSSTLNVIGLSVAFAAFIVMMMQVRYEWGYGKSDPNHKEIFRVERPSVFEKGQWRCNIDGLSIKYLRENEPRVKGCYYGDGILDVNVFMGSDSLSAIKAKYYVNWTNPTDMFRFEMVQGSAESLMEPNMVIIPLSLAKRLFADKGAIGEVLNIKGDYYRENRERTIVGVYRDFPDNATLKNYVFGGAPTGRISSDTGEIYNASIVYIRTTVKDTAQIIENLYKYDQANDQYGFGMPRSRLTSVGEIYYKDDVSVYGDIAAGNRSTTMLLFSISLLVIIIAGINFVNFSTAMAPLRIRGLNTRLVFGKPKSSLRVMLVAEAVCISILAFFVALLWVYCFNMSSVSELIRADSTAIADNLPVVIGAAIVAVFVGALAGIYPAFYCTRFSAALVLKGSGMGSASGQWLRSVLIGFQYVVSIALITVSIFIAVQNDYLSKFPLGFNKDNVFKLGMNNVTSENDRKRLSDALRQNPAVKDIAYSWGILGQGYGMMSSLTIENEKVNIGCMPVDYNFLKFFSIPIVEGRDFVESDIINKYPDKRGFVYDSEPMIAKVIFNRKAQQMYGIKVDSMYNNAICIGICDNINTRALYNDYEPMSFRISNTIGPAYIRVEGSNIDEIYKFIEQCYVKLDLGSYFDCQLLDSFLQSQYVAEHNLSRLVNLFTGLAILLSLVGVFGLVVFENQYRRREIGLRKIYGSTIGQILLRFNRKFLIIIAICFIVALPIAWWGVNEWLMTFAFRTQIHWWVFAAALSVVIVITVLTVTVQSWHSAAENPVKSLKSE